MTDSASLPQPPTYAVEIFGDRLSLIENFAGWLADAGVVRGLVGPREVPRLWERHLVNCAMLGDVLPAGATVADVGSGAGLPGLVLAIMRPDLSLTLIEPLLRRTNFLSEVVVALGLANVEVLRGRAESLHARRSFDVVTSRAVAPLDRLLTWSMPLVAPEGSLVAMKGSSVVGEIEAARPTLVGLGCAEPETMILGQGRLPSTTLVVRVAWADPSRVSLPSARSAAGRPSSSANQRRERTREQGKRRGRA